MTDPPSDAAQWVPRLLAAFVVLYALQGLYSEDVSKAIQNACFFLVPFTVAYGLLQDVEWDRRLLTLVLWVVGVEASLFVVVGTVELASRSLFWNEVVIRSNDFHTYFRVNSVFWDPNIYGRYLALVIVVAVAPLLWVRDRRDLALLSALVAFLWFGLAQTYSESSYLALLAGLALLAALRWNWRWTAGAVAIGVIGDRRDRRHLRQTAPQHPLQRPRRPGRRRARTVERTAAPGLRLGLLPERLPRPPREQGRAGVGLPHRAGHGRSPSRG